MVNERDNPRVALRWTTGSDQESRIPRASRGARENGSAPRMLSEALYQKVVAELCDGFEVINAQRPMNEDPGSDDPCRWRLDMPTSRRP